MKQTILKFLGSLSTIAFLGLLLLFGLKGCIVTTWVPPKQPASYAIQGQDDRSMAFTFLPDRRALIVYGDPKEKSFEAVLCSSLLQSYP